MTLSASNPSFARAPVRALVLSFAVLLGLLAPFSAQAERVVRVFDAVVKGEPTPAAVQEAMKRVLVRATGRREAADDPALSGIVADAQRFVQQTRPAATRGDTHIVFDGAAVEQAIAATGRSVWDSSRPFTIVVLQPPPVGPANEAARTELERAAETRGLPISIVPLAVTDPSGIELGRDALMQSVQRLGGDAVLVGRSDGAASSGPMSGQWHWTLHTDFSSETWTGGLDAGIHGAVDALARVQDASATLMELPALVQVHGVTGLSDYAAVDRLLNSLPGVRRAGVVETDGSTITFNVLARGGAEAVERALSASSRLARTGTFNGRLVYEYRR